MAEQQVAKIEQKAPPIAMGPSGMELRTLEDAFRFSKAIVASNLAPKGDTAETVLIKLQAGAELGFPPMRSLSALVVVNGRLSLEGQAALALIRAKGHPVEVCVEGEGDARRGVCRFKRNGVENEVAFSLADAKKAGLAGKDTYKAYLDDMLVWKAVSRAGKRYFSDVLLGLDVAEHVQDYTAANARKAAEPERTALPAPTTPDPLLDALDISPQQVVGVDLARPGADRTVKAVSCLCPSDPDGLHLPECPLADQPRIDDARE